MKILEITKKYTYNTKRGKTEWMMNKNNKRKSKDKEPELEVSSGKKTKATNMSNTLDSRGFYRILENSIGF